jgi:hypothetical protein
VINESNRIDEWDETNDDLGQDFDLEDKESFLAFLDSLPEGQEFQILYAHDDEVYFVLYDPVRSSYSIDLFFASYKLVNIVQQLTSKPFEFVEDEQVVERFTVT